MQIKSESLEPTRVKLTISGEAAQLEPLKVRVVNDLSRGLKVPGFRPGKAPASLVEKQVDQKLLQAEFLELAVNTLYAEAVQAEKLRPIKSPQVAISKFVPFDTLEFTAEVEIIGPIGLPDYKKIKLAPKPVTVLTSDVNEVLNNLRQRAAAKQPVKRPAKLGDEVNIDFVGKDSKTQANIDGTDGKDYPLLLGSQTFIPGFEDQLVGLKLGDSKAFDLTFPKDYGVQALQNRSVTFEVTVRQVKELQVPELNDAFAASLGPFKTLAELKADIKKQLTAERQREAQRAYENELLEKITAGSTIKVPESLIEEEIDRIEDEEKRNVTYRGQTWQEHLEAEGVTAEEHRRRQQPTAEMRIKAGLVLGEIADRENVSVSPQELEIRLQLLKGQYNGDPAMQAELDKPESRRDIHSRLMTEKTLDALRTYASKPKN